VEPFSGAFTFAFAPSWETAKPPNLRPSQNAGVVFLFCSDVVLAGVVAYAVPTRKAAAATSVERPRASLKISLGRLLKRVKVPFGLC